MRFKRNPLEHTDYSANLPSNLVISLSRVGFMSKNNLFFLVLFNGKAASVQHVTEQCSKIKEQLTDLVVSVDMLPVLEEQRAGGAALSFRSCKSFIRRSRRTALSFTPIGSQTPNITPPFMYKTSLAI